MIFFSQYINLFGSVFLSLVIIIILSFKNNRKEKNTHTDSDQLEPYGYFNHPHKSFVDKIVGYISSKYINVSLIVNYPCVMNTNTATTAKNDEHQNKKMNMNYPSESSMSTVLRRLRERMRKFDEFVYHLECKAWNKRIKRESKSDKDFLVGGTFLLPRNSNILSDWGIINVNCDYGDENSNVECCEEQDFVEVELVCPASAICGSFDIIDKTTSTCGYATISATSSPTSLRDLKLSPSVDIILDFHYGGMMFGSSKHGISGVTYVNALIKMQCNEQKKSKEQQDNKSGEEKRTSSLCPGLILISVNYRLAPDHLFPAQIIDGLSVSSYIFQYFPDSNIHFSGLSAGGNLSAVVGLESFRYYSAVAVRRRIKSITLVDPFILPETKTNSYFMNSKSSYHCPVEWLHWCWGAYLGLSLDGDDDDHGVDFLSLESYSNALSKCKWVKHNDNKGKDRDDKIVDNFIRLIIPQFDLPPNIHDYETQKKEETSSKQHLSALKPPMVIVVTSRADPLQDDGIDFVRKFKMGGGKNIVHIDEDGSHAMSILCNINAKRRFIKAWHDVIWDKE